VNIVTINGEAFSPEIVSEIDLKTSIIICGLEGNKDFLLNNNERIYLLNNKNDIVFNNLKIIENSYYIIEYNPHLRWSVPKGVNLSFIETRKPKSIFNVIYTNYIDIDSDPWTHDLLNISFSVYIDKERAKNLNKISVGERLFEIDIDYGPFVEESVEHIYILQNNFAFEEFKKHFDI
jgi:hypothetical protein